MWENPNRGYDRVLVKALINLIGVYPVGTCVILDSFEVAVVSAPNPDGEQLKRPAGADRGRRRWRPGSVHRHRDQTWREGRERGVPAIDRQSHQSIALWDHGWRLLRLILCSTRTWAALSADGRRALIPYLTAGYPTRDASAAALRAAAEIADIIEVGVPFSDPLADGPTIQRSTFEALQQGMTLAGTLELIAGRSSAVPSWCSAT